MLRLCIGKMNPMFSLLGGDLRWAFGSSPRHLDSMYFRVVYALVLLQPFAFRDFIGLLGMFVCHWAFTVLRQRRIPSIVFLFVLGGFYVLDMLLGRSTFDAIGKCVGAVCLSLLGFRRDTLVFSGLCTRFAAGATAFKVFVVKEIEAAYGAI